MWQKIQDMGSDDKRSLATTVVVGGAGLMLAGYMAKALTATDPSERKAYLASVSTYNPKMKVTMAMFKRFYHKCRNGTGVTKFADGRSVLDFCDKLLDSSGIANRHTVCPSFRVAEDGSTIKDELYREEDDILSEKYGFNPPARVRLAMWKNHMPELVCGAARNAIEQWGGDISTITHVIGTSTSGWCEPGITSTVISTLGLSNHCCKVELSFNGCFCGVTAMRVARDIVLAQPNRTVLIVAMEIGGGHMDTVTTVRESLVPLTLFADGSGSAVVTNRVDSTPGNKHNHPKYGPVGLWEMKNWGTYLIPDTKKLMIWNESEVPEYGGYTMILDKKAPDMLAKCLLTQLGPTLLMNYLKVCGVAQPAFAVHTGGRRIIDLMKDAFNTLGWRDDFKEHYGVLNEVGNLATVCVFHLLQRQLSTTKRNNCFILGFGPGMTVEYGFLSRAVAK